MQMWSYSNSRCFLKLRRKKNFLHSQGVAWQPLKYASPFLFLLHKYLYFATFCSMSRKPKNVHECQGPLHTSWTSHLNAAFKISISCFQLQMGDRCKKKKKKKSHLNFCDLHNLSSCRDKNIKETFIFSPPPFKLALVPPSPSFQAGDWSV